MQGITEQAPELGAIVEFLPQPRDAMSVLENVTVDPSTFGWSTRVGYEKYRPDPADDFRPWQTLGPIYSLFVYEAQPGGSRYSILLEAGGTLYLYYEVGGEGGLLALQSGRTIPAPNEYASVYTVVSDGVLVTNGRDAPIIVRCWPLPTSGTLTTVPLIAQQLVEPLGFGYVSAPDLMGVTTVSGSTSATPPTSPTATGDYLNLWWPSTSGGISHPGEYGLGFSAGPASGTGQKAEFNYKCTFLKSDGSESPLSGEGFVQWELEAGAKGFRYCTGMRIPIGPPGTVARRIYRTQNQSFDSPTYGDSDFYFIDQIANNVEDLWYDPYRSSAVGAQAPAITESMPFPAGTARSSAIFGDCLWLDGGSTDPYTLHYSKPGRAHQFASTDFLRLSAPGGGIVRLFAHYNVLIILRENGVDVVRGDPAAGFTVTTVTSQISCRAPNTIDQVPGLGVVFLALDGIYALTGGFDGGSEMSVIRLSEPIKRTLQRLTPDCAPRAVGRYSPKDRAYHCYFAADGNDRPNLGVVYHVEKEGWSTRTGFPVGSLDRLYNGQLIFGHNTGTEAGADCPAGLFVLSARRAMGGAIVGDSYVEAGPPTSKLQSAWLDLGDAQMQKRVQYVTLWLLTSGSVTVQTYAYKDFERAGGANRPFLSQPPDAAAQPVYDTVVIGSGEWDEARLVPLRIPVAQQSAAWFKWELVSTDDMTVIGYEVEYKLPGTQVIAGRRA